MNFEINYNDTKLKTSKKEVEKSKIILKTIYEKKIARNAGTLSENLQQQKNNLKG